jgi:excisionase family DNA binding protein
MKDEPKEKDEADELVDGGLASIAEAGRFLSLGRSKIYDLIGRGRLPSVKIDRSRRIPRAALRAFARDLQSTAE